MSNRVFHRLAGTELWERFSLHGMKALLALYLVREVLAEGRPAPWGMAALRALFESLWGPLTPLALGSQIYGLYAALTYLVLPLGGVFGDRVTGRRAAVVAGGLCIIGGHVTLATEYLLLPALALLILGTGLLKANLAAQAGQVLAAQGGERGRGFAIYLAFLNLGVMLGPLVCGWLGQAWGWRYAFAAAAIGMAIGLVLYLGTPALPPAQKREAPEGAANPGRPIAALAAIGCVVIAFCAYEQVSNIFLLWIASSIRLTVAGFAVPPAWFASADGVFTIAMIGLVMRSSRLAKLDDWQKLAAGCAAIVAGYLVLALVAAAGWRSMAGPLGALLLLDLGVALLWPAGLAIVTGTAPAHRTGLMVGLFYLHGFFANLVVGALGTVYERMPVAAFWMLHAGIGGLALLVAIGLRQWSRAAALPGSARR